MKKMMNVLFLVLTLGLASTAFAAPSEIFAKWSAVHQDNGFTFNVSLMIQPNQTVFTNVCTYQGQSATATLTVATTATDTQFLIKEEKRADVTVNGVNCNVSTTVSTMDYQVYNNKLFLSYQGQTIELDRAN